MIKNHANIAILMATYNGERFLCEQIDSLLGQTYQDWHLYVHDDGSKDGTIPIVKDYSQKHPNKVTLLDYSSQGGAGKNFLSMLEKVDANYYMFCDQDDVWLPEKIEKTYESMVKTEEQNPNTPVIIHTDLIVVNKEKEMIDHSYWHFECMYPSWIKHYADHAALQYVTGCTMMFNKIAKEVTPPPCDRTVLHDSWVTLSVAAVEGVIYTLPDASILYRQHESNTLGAGDGTKRTLYYKFCHLCNVIRLNTIHFMEINAIRKISVKDYLIAKIRYKLYTAKKQNSKDKDFGQHYKFTNTKKQ